MGSRLYSIGVLIVILLIGCKSQFNTYYTPSIYCELMTPDEKVVLRSAMNYSVNKRLSIDTKKDKNNVINGMYEKLFFNGLRQNNCELNQLIFDPNPRVNYSQFLNQFWNDNNRENNFHKVLRQNIKTNSLIYVVEFDVNKLKNYLNENNIK